MDMIDLIYTFERAPQLFLDYPFNEEVLKDKETFAKFALVDLSAEEIEQLVKISFCVYCKDEIEIPDWIIECNGKLWFQNGELDNN